MIRVKTRLRIVPVNTKEKQNKTYQIIQKYLLFPCSGWVGILAHEVQGDADADHAIRQRKSRQKQADQRRQVLAAKNVGDRGGKQVEHNQKPEPGISWLIEFREFHGRFSLELSTCRLVPITPSVEIGPVLIRSMSIRWRVGACCIKPCSPLDDLMRCDGTSGGYSSKRQGQTLHGLVLLALLPPKKSCWANWQMAEMMG